MPLFTDEGNSKITSVVNFTPSKFGSLPQGVLKVHITKPCAHLHQGPSTSIQLHPVPSTSTQLSAIPSTVFEPKYCTYLGNFPKFRANNSKLSTLTENWFTWYLGGADSKSDLDFEILTQKPFFGQIWSQKVKVVCFV